MGIPTTFLRVIHGIEGVATTEVAHSSLTGALAEARKILEAGHADKFKLVAEKTGLILTDDAAKKVANLSWLDRQIISIKHWFANTVKIVENGTVQMKEGFETLIERANKFVPGANGTVQEAQKIATTLGDLTPVLSNKASIIEVIEGRLKDKTKFKDEPAHRLLNTLMNDVKGNHIDIAIKKLSKADKKKFEADVKNQMYDNLRMLGHVGDDGKFVLKALNKAEEKALFEEAANLAKVQVLDKHGLLPRLMEKCPDIKKAVTVAHNPKFKAPTFENVKNASLKKGLTKAEFENLTKAEKKAFREAFETEKVALAETMVKEGTVKAKILEKAKDNDHLLTDAQVATIEKEIAEKKVAMHYGQSKKTKAELKETLEKRIKDAHKTGLAEFRPMYDKLAKKGTTEVTTADKDAILNWFKERNVPNVNMEMFKPGQTDGNLRNYLKNLLDL